ncbi:hypothetical protein CIK05_04815 [Bdellovibrio sp. qaytius]|nr:hypothetical protein CIK05_04815 [Bdellovibrio sp. qaytius]
MKKMMYVNNTKGFTIAELLIAVALTSIVGLGVFEALHKNTEIQRMFGKKMDDRIEVNLADKLILRDLRAAGPSLNNLKITDDKNLNFYDFEPDRSSNFYRGQKTVSRTVTLIQGGNTFMYFLSFDDLRGKALFADAVTFFEVGAPPNNIYQPASLTYRGINYNGYLTAKDSAGNDLNNPKLMDPTNINKLVLVDSSSYMPTIPLRPAVFIGKIVNTGAMVDIQKISSAEIPKDKTKKDIWDYIITTPDNATIDPADFIKYMYNLPPVGANGASVRIKPVRLYKYELDCSVPAECILYRQDVLHGTSAQRIPIMRGFNCIKFIRNDIATSIFQVAMDKNLCANP